MIITCKDKFELILPVFFECNRKCIYLLILQNNFTKEVFMFKVRDTSNNHLRTCIRMEMQDCMNFGEYTYYLVEDSEWNNVDVNIIANTKEYTKKSAIKTGDMFVVVDNKLLVTSWFKGKLYSCGDQITSEGKSIITWDKDHSNDTSIVKCINIISTGLLKYKAEHITCEVGFDSNDTYYEFENK